MKVSICTHCGLNNTQTTIRASFFLFVFSRKMKPQQQTVQETDPIITTRSPDQDESCTGNYGIARQEKF